MDPSPTVIETVRGSLTYQRDHDERSLGGPLAEVLERRSHRPVAVETEHEQVENGGRTGCVVDGYPQLTTD